MGLGYGLSYRVYASDLAKQSTRERLLWLDRLQKSVCARYIGQPVVAFVHDRGTNLAIEPNGVIHATYGPVNLTANLTPRLQPEGGNTLAPFGFVATAPGMIAAQLASDAGSNSVSFVVEDKPHNGEFWVYSTGERSVSIQLPRPLDGTASVGWDLGTSTNTPVQNGVLTLNLGF